jgi:hypothetical protein
MSQIISYVYFRHYLYLTHPRILPLSETYLLFIHAYLAHNWRFYKHRDVDYEHRKQI